MLTDKPVNLPMAAIDTIATIAKEFGFKYELEQNDSNGWQYDFWCYFYKNDVKYCLSGSWYYGDYTLSKFED